MSKNELRPVSTSGIKDEYSFCPFCGEKFDESIETNVGIAHTDGCKKGFLVKRLE